jgi:nucleotide-binding universal stress UspA family protein
MDKNKTIVVGVNESSSCRAAIRYAAHLAERDGSRLMLVHVVPQVIRTGGLYAVKPDYVERTSRDLLIEAVLVAEGLLAPGRVSTQLVHGATVAGLVRAAEYARTVVLGTDLRPAVERFAGGSTIVGVSSHCPRPVYIVPAAWTEPAGHPRLTVGVRDIAGADELLRAAFTAAEEADARLLVTHASGLPNADSDPAAPAAHTDPPSRRLADLLAARVDAVGAEHPDVEYDVRVVHGPATRVLRALSESSDVLMLERREHAWHGAQLGRTARSLLRASYCPVLIVPPHRCARDQDRQAGSVVEPHPRAAKPR